MFKEVFYTERGCPLGSSIGQKAYPAPLYHLIEMSPESDLDIDCLEKSRGNSKPITDQAKWSRPKGCAVSPGTEQLRASLLQDPKEAWESAFDIFERNPSIRAPDTSIRMVEAPTKFREIASVLRAFQPTLSNLESNAATKALERGGPLVSWNAATQKAMGQNPWKNPQ